MTLPNIPANPLRDIVPARYRRYVYAVIALVAIGWSAYQGSDGDWRSLIGGLIVALVHLTAASNTNVPTPVTTKD